MMNVEHNREQWFPRIAVADPRRARPPVTHAAKLTQSPTDRKLKLAFELCKYVFDEVAESLEKSRPETAVDMAVSLGDQLHRRIAEFAKLLVTRAKEQGDGSLLRTLAANRDEDLGATFGKLDADAIAFVRSTEYLKRLLDEHNVPAPDSESEPCSSLWRKHARLYQTLLLLGTWEHKVSKAVQVELARAYWQSLLSLVPEGQEELVDDAFFSGQHDQAMAEHGDEMSLEALERELGVGT